jgi:hypothetical protein
MWSPPWPRQRARTVRFILLVSISLFIILERCSTGCPLLAAMAQVLGESSYCRLFSDYV